MTTAISKPIFISYSTADTTTEQIRDHLEAAGIACWMVPRAIAPGQDYAEQISNAIEGCTVLLLALSETSNHSQYRAFCRCCLLCAAGCVGCG